jgi:methionine-rich copper-binding protein CopC
VPGWRPVLIGLLSIVASFAAAHTSIKATVPANEARLEKSPAVIEIAFGHIAQLTSVVVVTDGQAPRKLAFEPLGNAFAFKLTQPRLAPGRNEVRWKGLSSDGHVFGGTLVYTVDPAAAGATPPN